MENNVVDIKTKKALFNDCIRDKVEAGLKPYIKAEASAVDAASAVEQVLCTAIIGFFRGLATRFATKLVEKITKPAEVK